MGGSGGGSIGESSALMKGEAARDGTGSIGEGSALIKGETARLGSEEDSKTKAGSSGGGYVGVVVVRYEVLSAMVNHVCLFRPSEERPVWFPSRS
jgi:hypothetical protein